ncbi:hypothetical protein [Turicibacter sanguinis]|uniref:hypothetical protein n=1 Tax=Turicibacter sanguinis TaxID=154288 RepID=UPI00399A8965
MKIRLGYVAIALKLDKVTSSSPVTYKNYSALSSKREQLSLLMRVTKSNLHDLIKILNYNAKQEIHFYRMTSKLIPLATHQEVLWDYSKVIQEECQEVADLIKKYDMRVDAHPDQFNVLNSSNEAVINRIHLYLSCIYLSYLILSLLNLFYMWKPVGRGGIRAIYSNISSATTKYSKGFNH